MDHAENRRLIAADGIEVEVGHRISRRCAIVDRDCPRK
jgi:hypothetical protein